MAIPFAGGIPAFEAMSSPWIGAQAGVSDLMISPGAAAYPAANATVYRVYEYAVPVTTVATVPSAAPAGAIAPAMGATPFGAAPFGTTPFGYV